MEEGGTLELESVEEVGLSEPEAVEEMAAIDKDQKKLALAFTALIPWKFLYWSGKIAYILQEVLAPIYTAEKIFEDLYSIN